MTPALIVLGSTNPAKRHGVELALARAFPHAVPELRCVAVPSGVPDQPWGDAETRRGAVLRAQAALAGSVGDGVVAVGIEGGVERGGDLMWSFSWAVVEATGAARSAAFLLPPGVARAVAAGQELGDAIDDAFGVRDARRDAGAVGLLTRGAIDRAELHAQAVVLALMPLLQRELFR